MGDVPTVTTAAYITGHGSPDAIRVGELPVPEPGPTDVIVRTEALAVNHVDTFVRSGSYRTHTPFPFVIGRDLVGTVAARGAGVAEFRAGDRVWCNSLGHDGSTGVVRPLRPGPGRAALPVAGRGRPRRRGGGAAHRRDRAHRPVPRGATPRGRDGGRDRSGGRCRQRPRPARVVRGREGRRDGVRTRRRMVSLARRAHRDRPPRSAGHGPGRGGRAGRGGDLLGQHRQERHRGRTARTGRRSADHRHVRARRASRSCPWARSTPGT